ncbi:MAG: DNA alkylation repair protein [Gaiellales bacterium]|nr:DNA alkylation repair protein [Gaiellales bacterium]
MSPEEIIDTLRAHADPLLAGALERLGAPPGSALGVDLPFLEDLARDLRPNHTLAVALWERGLRETRLLAIALADPRALSEEQAQEWVDQADTTELADYLATRLLEKTPVGRRLAPSWSLSSQDMVRRVGFLLMTRLSIDDAGHPDARFPGYFAPPGNEAPGRCSPLRAAMRFLGRRNRRTAWKAVELARHAQLQFTSQRDQQD